MYIHIYIYIYTPMNGIFHEITKKKYLITNLICFTLTGGWGSGDPLFESTVLYSNPSHAICFSAPKTSPSAMSFVIIHLWVCYLCIHRIMMDNPIHNMSICACSFAYFKRLKAWVKFSFLLRPVMSLATFSSGFHLEVSETPNYGSILLAKKEVKLLLWWLKYRHGCSYVFIYFHNGLSISN